MNRQGHRFEDEIGLGHGKNSNFRLRLGHGLRHSHDFGSRTRVPVQLFIYLKSNGWTLTVRAEPEDYIYFNEIFQ